MLGVIQMYVGEPDHIKVYGEGMWRVCTLTIPAQKLIITLLRQVTPAECGMRVMLNATAKSNLCKDLGMELSLLNHKLKELEEIGMIRLKTRNLYEINPWLFGKGDWIYVSRLRKTWEVIDL